MASLMHGNVKSLYLLCKNVLIKHVDTICDVGDLDYALVRPVLLKISSPNQLKKIEKKCPQIAGEDAEIWQQLISRDFGHKAVKKYTPANPKSWSKIYDKHQREAEENAKKTTLELKAQMTKMTSAKAQSRAKLITNTSGLPPTNSRPRGYSNIGGSGSGGGGGGSSNWNTKAGSKTKNIIEKARREAKELSVFRGRNSVLAAPTHTLKRQELSKNMVDMIRTKMVTENGEGNGEGGKRKAEEGIGGGGGKLAAVSRGGLVVGPPPGKLRKLATADPFLRRKR